MLAASAWKKRIDCEPSRALASLTSAGTMSMPVYATSLPTAVLTIASALDEKQRSPMGMSMSESRLKRRTTSARVFAAATPWPRPTFDQPEEQRAPSPPRIHRLSA
eukprot:6192779-Pleurochrysis_carterae.AAC.1